MNAANTADQPSAELRTALLDAAELEIEATGAAGASLRAIARRAGVSHQAPAYAFSNRRGLFTALAARSLQRLHGHLEAASASDAERPPLERLARLGMAYIEFAQANPGLFTLVSSPDQIEGSDPVLTDARERAWAVLSDCVAEAQRSGWRADQPTTAVAMACWALVQGSAGLWREGWLGIQFPDASIPQLVREMLASSL